MNVDGSTIDIYLDGRLHISRPGVNIPTNSTAKLTVGNKFNQGQIKNIGYHPVVIDPPTVYQHYVNNAAISALASMNSQYNVDMDFTKDNATVASIHVM